MRYAYLLMWAVKAGLPPVFYGAILRWNGSKLEGHLRSQQFGLPVPSFTSIHLRPVTAAEVTTH